jgi:hypothetical protein
MNKPTGKNRRLPGRPPKGIATVQSPDEPVAPGDPREIHALIVENDGVLARGLQEALREAR